jgi:heme exporter protein A
MNGAAGQGFPKVAYNPRVPTIPNAPPTSLRFDGIHRGFGRLRVLRGVSGGAAAGEALLVTGSNGSGKSTLLRCLAGLAAPERGTIECRVGGDVLDLAERRRAIGYVAPVADFYRELTTAENLDFFGRLRGVGADVGRRLLDELGLPHDRLAGALSSGMLQRLRWAGALLHRPPILLLDEPLQNLDAPGRRDVLRLLDRHLESGLAVVANPDRLEIEHVARHLDLDD